MIVLETRAVIIQIDGNEATVEPINSGGCSSCRSDGGCGSGKLSQMLCREPRHFKVKNNARAKVGETVLVTFPEAVLLRGALLIYGLPVVFLLLGALLGKQWGAVASNPDGYGLLGALMGLAIGIGLAAVLSRNQRKMAVAESLIS